MPKGIIVDPPSSIGTLKEDETNLIYCFNGRRGFFKKGDAVTFEIKNKDPDGDCVRWAKKIHKVKEE